MSKIYLFAGASSAIAQVLAQKLSEKGYMIIGLSTKAQLPKQFQYKFQVNSYEKNDLPDISETLDGLVYFPGSINLKPFNRITADDFLNDYKLNSLGAVNVIQKYLPNLKNASTASIVLISTVAAIQGMPYHASISMAKGAIEGLTLALAAELAPTIRVNAVAPALTATPLAEKLINSSEKLDASNKRHPLKRIGQPQDIGNAIGFLLGNESDWITGQILNVDGGMSSVRVL